MKIKLGKNEEKNKTRKKTRNKTNIPTRMLQVRKYLVINSLITSSLLAKGMKISELSSFSPLASRFFLSARKISFKLETVSFSKTKRSMVVTMASLLVVDPKKEISILPF